jgi:hypothetical protein
LESLDILLLLGEGFLCSGHSFDEFGDFDVVFMRASGGEGEKEESFEHVMDSTNNKNWAVLKF